MRRPVVATVTVQAAAVALLAGRPSVAAAGAAGVAALILLLLAHQARGWRQLVPGAVLATAVAVLGSLVTGPRWLGLAVPVALVTLYALATFSLRYRRNRETAPDPR